MNVGDWVQVRATGEGGEIHAISGSRCTLRQVNGEARTYRDLDVAIADVDPLPFRRGSPIRVTHDGAPVDLLAAALDADRVWFDIEGKAWISIPLADLA